MKNKKNLTKKILLGLLWIIGLLDFGTAISGNMRFEVNPLYLLTGQVWLLFIVKFGIILGLTWLVWTYKPKPNKTRVWSYLFILTIIYAIVLQGLGAWSNITTQTEYLDTAGTEEEIQPLPKDVAYKSFFFVMVLIGYIPILLATLSFWCWERIYL